MRRLLLVLALVLLATGVVRAVADRATSLAGAPTRSVPTEPAGAPGPTAEPPWSSASWIWATKVFDVAPSSAVFVRDFDLPHPGEGELILRAGDAWVAWVNGQRIAAAATRDRCGIARVPLGPRLREGPNRIAIEVRFERRMAGILGCVVVDGRCEVPTDGRWSYERAADPALLHGWRLARGVPALVLAPADLASGCLALEEGLALDCLEVPVDIELTTLRDEAETTRLVLEQAGLLELVVAPRETSTVAFVEAPGAPQWRVEVLEGAVAALDVSLRPAGPVEVRGVAPVGAVLWPLGETCAPQQVRGVEPIPALYGIQPQPSRTLHPER